MHRTSIASIGSFAGSFAGSYAMSSITDASNVPDEPEPPPRTIEDAASPINQEIHIQRERLTSIIDLAIAKTKLAVCLPQMMDESLLAGTLTPQHLSEVMLIYKQYSFLEMSQSAYVLNSEALEDIRKGDFSIRNRVSPELAHLIHILIKYPSIKDKAEEIIKQAKAAGDSPALSYLQTLEDFRGLLLRRLAISAADDLDQKLRIEGLRDASNRNLLEICVIEATLVAERQTHEMHMLKKEMTLDDLNKQLACLQSESKNGCPKEILDSERRMVMASRAHAVQMEILKEEETSWRESCQAMLDHHLQDEKALRARRRKVTTQLQSWVQKYDLEMEEKQQELDDITKQCDAEAKIVEELEAQLSEQDLEYVPEMEEREAEYAQEMANKMHAFRHEHAARVIQHAWREVLQNRKIKQKMKRLARLAQKAAARENQ